MKIITLWIIALSIACAYLKSTTSVLTKSCASVNRIYNSIWWTIFTFTEELLCLLNIPYIALLVNARFRSLLHNKIGFYALIMQICLGSYTLTANKPLLSCFATLKANITQLTGMSRLANNYYWNNWLHRKQK